MKIRINDRDVDIFEGARLQDAIRKYSRSLLKSVKNRDKKVVDEDGNQMSLDGELLNGDSFYIREC